MSLRYSPGEVPVVAEEPVVVGAAVVDTVGSVGHGGWGRSSHRIA
ncbi:MAG: hypothetical protein PVH19_01775 [Planctomycetia bacterium]